jgi:O-succinylbenzoate synthase
LPGDTSASDRYFVRDVTEPFVLEEGYLAVPTGPGIGREPLSERMNAILGSRETFSIRST